MFNALMGGMYQPGPTQGTGMQGMGQRNALMMRFPQRGYQTQPMVGQQAQPMNWSGHVQGRMQPQPQPNYAPNWSGQVQQTMMGWGW